MTRGRSLMMALVLTLAPLPLLAQGGQGQGRAGMGGPGGGMAGARALLEQGSVEFLVTKAADLQLTADQSAQLKTIGEAWSAATKDARAQIAAALPQPGQQAGGDMQEMRQRMQSLMPVMQKLREDDEKAVEDAMKLLDATQQPKAKALLEERLAAMRPRR